MGPIVIYDDKCKVCTAFGMFGKGVIPLGFHSEEGRRLLRAQFGEDYGFSFVFFSEEYVSWSSDAVADYTRDGYSSFAGKYFRRLIKAGYPFFARVLGFINNREVASDPPSFRGRKLPYTGRMPLTKKALSEFRRIAKKQKRKKKGSLKKRTKKERKKERKKELLKNSLF